MADLKSKKQASPIAYSCYFTRNREGEQFSSEHVFSYQISGTLTINNGEKEYVFKEGDFRFTRRNQLLKFIKQPPVNGVFKSISVYLDQGTLRSFAMEHGYHADHSQSKDAGSIIALKGGSLVKGFMDSLMPYSEDDQMIDANLQALKVREAIMILLRSSSVMKDILFDFSEPGKIDLEAFMNENFHFNVQINRFAYLTGRSLATFKRDFEHIFHTSPSRWLQQRRLQEAHYLIKEKGRAPSDVYLEIGFEDLSHFSFAFKKAFGIPPSRLAG
ncbi:hypothetical protein GCM10007423_26650 [Dyadobacter endophyticus]|uniref:HTH araC/xylS-type domain-containing protein n=1 Tax=Dyadobacter endophyticus TaxID=1749036 RepID=A0ABQ1YSQ2_9BACT|nr:AraC family transcriptional regulator [Dyadobacter endophyticus]GGH35202.1 hypothetical protein GCM10007423_26650 [Dyadobacter endophyticus]